MKKALSVITQFLSITIFILSANAQELSPTDKFGIELLYAHFESHYTPKNQLHMTQKRAIYISEKLKENHKTGMDAIREFNLPFSQWNQQDGMHIQFNINNTEKGWIEAHPNPALHKLRFIENLASNYKDHNGRLTEVEGFSKVKKTPQGVWVSRYSTFIKSKTKINSPYYILSCYVAVSGTPYHVVSHMPFRGYSIAEMEKTENHLNSMVEHWSIME